MEIEVGPRGGWFPDGKVHVDLEWNTRLLLENGWMGVQIDGHQYSQSLNVKTEFITAENIHDVLTEYKVPNEFDLFSLDVGGNDNWIWKALMYEPRVVAIEYNPNLGINESKAT